MARVRNDAKYQLSNFTVDFEPCIDNHGRPDDRFVLQTCTNIIMYVRVDEMANILNGLIEIEKIERDPENDKCFAHSRVITSDAIKVDTKYLIASRLGDKLKVRLVEFIGSRSQQYNELLIDLHKDDVFDLSSYVLRTLNYHSEHFQMFFSL